MPLAAGAKPGPYEVLSPIGADERFEREAQPVAALPAHK